MLPVVRHTVIVPLMTFVLVSGCAAGQESTARRADAHAKVSPSVSAASDQCGVPAAQRAGGWVCQTRGGLVPADREEPAAGICASATGPLAIVEVNPDTPIPRCLVVRPDQRLKVVNTSDRFGAPGTEVVVTMPGFAPRRLAIGAGTVFDRPFGDYLATGVHDLGLSLYGEGGMSIWLK